MTRLTRSRAVVTTGLVLGTTTLGLALAPSALAAEELAPLEGAATATVGQPLAVTGEGCANPADGAHADEPTTVYVDVYTAAGWADPAGEPVLTLDGTPEDGAWTAAVLFDATATPGEYVVIADCETYDGLEGYPEFTFTLNAAAVATPSTPAATAPKVGEIRGAAANTAGVASVKTGATTTAAPAPGTKVVKVYKGFKPGEVVTLTMHSTPVTLGKFTANANGEVTVSFTVPAGTEAGTHTLVLNGNMGTYFQEDITVAAAVATASSSGLAYTGADVAVPLALGAGLLALGGGAMVVSRRRTGATQA